MKSDTFLLCRNHNACVQKTKDKNKAQRQEGANSSSSKHSISSMHDSFDHVYKASFVLVSD